jgi:hypothetical protein
LHRCPEKYNMAFRFCESLGLCGRVGPQANWQRLATVDMLPWSGEVLHSCSSAQLQDMTGNTVMAREQEDPMLSVLHSCTPGPRSDAAVVTSRGDSVQLTRTQEFQSVLLLLGPLHCALLSGVYRQIRSCRSLLTKWWSTWHFIVPGPGSRLHFRRAVDGIVATCRLIQQSLSRNARA